MVSITEESTVGRRIVTAAEYDRWKAVNDEIHVDVKCSAEEVIVTLEGALPHTPCMRALLASCPWQGTGHSPNQHDQEPHRQHGRHAKVDSVEEVGV